MTAEPVAAGARLAIEADAKRLNRRRAWWCEGINFFEHADRPDHLVGDTKLFIVSLGDDLDGEDGADGLAAIDDDQFMAFHDGRFILLTLAEWSRVHGVSWGVEMAGQPVARVSGGRIDPPDRFGADAPAEQLRADEERARLTIAKYPQR